MKYTLITLLLANFIAADIFSQSIIAKPLICDTINLDDANVEKYKTAYEYVITDSLFRNKRIKVSDKVISTSYGLHSKILFKKPHSVEAAMELYHLDEIGRVKNVYIVFDKVFNIGKTPNPEYMISFSKIINNDLFIEVEESKSFGTFWGGGTIYFLRFNPDGTIKEAHRGWWDGL